MSHLLAEMYKFLRIKPIHTSPYHPQTDGLVERFNQTLKAMIRKVTISEGCNWEILLPYVLFAYQEVLQASTGFSPFELLYGREVYVVQADENIILYVMKMRDRLSEMSEIVRENVPNAQQTQKQWYNRTARVRQFNPRDRILVLLPTSTHKLRAQWQGPFPIIERRGKVNYIRGGYG